MNNTTNITSRETPLSVRLYLRLCSTPEANIGWAFAIFGFGFALLAATVVHDNTKFGAGLAIGCGSVIGMFALYFPIRAWFIGGEMIRQIQDGIAIQATFHGVKLQDRKQNAATVDFEYQVNEKTYRVSTHIPGVYHLTTATCNVVFYDATQPEHAVALSHGINFDEQTERLAVNSFRWVSPLLSATIVCSEVVAVAVLVILAS